MKYWNLKINQQKYFLLADQFLLAFLRGNKHSLERSKEKLDMFYTLRTVVPEIYRDRNPFDPVLQDFLKLG